MPATTRRCIRLFSMNKLRQKVLEVGVRPNRKSPSLRPQARKSVKHTSTDIHLLLYQDRRERGFSWTAKPFRVSWFVRRLAESAELLPAETNPLPRSVQLKRCHRNLLLVSS